MAVEVLRDLGVPVSRPEWREVLASDPDALVYQTPEWIDAICATALFVDASRLYRRPDGRRMVLPMVRPMFAPGRCSLPAGWGPGGLVSEGEVDADDVAMVLDDLRQFHLVQVRTSPTAHRVWESEMYDGLRVVDHVGHVLDLTGGWDAVWNDRFPKNTRQRIRRAARNGVEVWCDSSAEALGVFYDIYDQWLENRAKDRGIPVVATRWLGHHREPRKRFEEVRSALGDACTICVARLEGLPVAGAVQLSRGNHSIVWRNFTDRTAMGPIPANYMLHRCMIEVACNEGRRYYHFGESGGVESLMHFKEQFGARAHTSIEWVREPEAISWLRRVWRSGLQTIERAVVTRPG